MGYIRLLLACIVLVDHSGGLPTMSAWAAVELFFVISGFYMALTYDANYRGSGGWRNFYVSRAIRIYPLYVFVLALMLAAVLFFGVSAFPATQYRSFIYFTQPQDALQHISAQTLFFQDILSLDSHRAEALPVRQGWSLSAEIIFYLLTPWLAARASSSLCGLAALSFALKWVLLRYLGDLWAYLPSPAELGYFILGMLTFRLRGRIALGPAAVKSLIGIFVLVSLIPWDTSFETHFLRFFPIGNLGLVALLCTLLQADRNGRLPWQREIGNLSYGVYLIHMVVIEVLRGLDVIHVRAIFALSAIAICIFLSWVWETAIQRPLDCWRRRVFHLPWTQDGARSW